MATLTDPFALALAEAAERQRRREEEERQRKLREEAEREAAARGAYAPRLIQDNFAPAAAGQTAPASGLTATLTARGPQDILAPGAGIFQRGASGNVAMAPATDQRAIVSTQDALRAAELRAPTVTPDQETAQRNVLASLGYAKATPAETGGVATVGGQPYFAGQPISGSTAQATAQKLAARTAELRAQQAAPPAQTAQAAQAAPGAVPSGQARPPARQPLAAATGIPAASAAVAQPPTPARQATPQISAAGTAQFPATLAQLMQNPEQWNRYVETVRSLLAAKYNPKVLAEQQQLETVLPGFEQQRGQLSREFTDAQKRLREYYASRGLLDYGYEQAGQDRALEQYTRQVGQLGSQEQLARQQAAARVASLREAEANELLPEIQRLFNEDREFQENVRRFGLNYAIEQADTNLRLQRGYGLMPYEIEAAKNSAEQGAFSLQTAQLMRPGQLTAQALANRTAELGIQRTEGTLPYDIAGARTGQEAKEFELGRAQDLAPIGLAQANLGLIRERETLPFQISQAEASASQAVTAARAANEELYRDIEWFRQNPFEDRALDLRVARINADLKEWERDVAADPQYGATAEAKQRLEKARADIDAVKALAEDRRKGEALTTWQQYQQGRDITADQRRAEEDKAKVAKESKTARDDAVKSLTSSYNATVPAAQAWTDIMGEITKAQDAGYQVTMNDVSTLIQDVASRPGISANDQRWLNLMMAAMFGVGGAAEQLDTLRKDYDPYK